MMPKQQRGYQQPNLDSPITRPTALVMQCFPERGKPYTVAYIAGRAATFSSSGTQHRYPVIKNHDDQDNHVFYVTLQAPDQERAIFLAFDYSQRVEDVSTLATKLPRQPQAKDKCFMDWATMRQAAE
jgi:hypothetical protein